MIYKNRFLILRRVVQVGFLFLYVMANVAGWRILEGNLSSSLVLGNIPLSDPYAVIQILLAGGLIAANAIVGAVIIFFVYAMFLGRAFCSWVCPINMVTDLANYLRKVFEAKDVERRQYMSRNIRYYVLALSLVLSLLLGLPAFEFVSPIAMMHRGIVFGMGFGFAALAVIFLFDLFVHKNGWCGYVCPLGGFWSLTTRYSLIRVQHHQEKCTLCMKCKDVCPEKEVLELVGKRSGPVSDGACINCGRCVEVCDDDALNFSIRSLIEKRSENEKL